MDSRMETCFDSIVEFMDALPVGIVVFECLGGSYHVVGVNDAFCKWDHIQMDEQTEELNKNLFYRVHPNDVDKLEQIILSCAEKKEAQMEYRYWNAYDSRYMWSHFYGRVYDSHDGHQYIIAVCSDITEEKERARSLRMQKDRVELALDSSQLDLWEYDVINHCSIHSNRASKTFGIRNLMENMPQSMIDTGVIHADSIEAYRALFDQIEQGAALVEKEIHMQDCMNHDRWYRVCLKNQYDEKGKPFYATGWIEEITENRMAVQRLQEQEQFLKDEVSEDLLTKALFNITQNRILSCEGRDDVVIARELQKMTYEQGKELLMQVIVKQEDKQIVWNALDRRSLLRKLNDGVDRYVFDYQRRLNDGRVVWVHTLFILRTNPVSGDVIAFLYTYDIDKYRFTHAACQNMVDLNYDFVGIIDVESGSWKSLGNSQKKNMPHGYYPSYDEEMRRMAKESSVKDDQTETVETDIEKILLESVIGHLETEPVYRLNHLMWDEDTASLRSYYSLFRYIDDTRSQILICRMDVSDALATEMSRQQVLEKALQQAEHANDAKSAFLSHMSHEIRTPMNSIMGMTELALQNLNDVDQIRELLEQARESERYLLSLINNILDVSQIESGKTQIEKSRFSLRALVAGVNGIIRTQVQKKELHYDLYVDEQLEANYLGDGVKMQQVLVNLLGNSIKFTRNGGRLSFDVLLNSIDQDRSWVEFRIKDTGVGMSEEFQKRMFDPFEQEFDVDHEDDLQSRLNNEGTGLGLMISKNLVNLMGGEIQVNSKRGEGTQFTILIPLERCEDCRDELSRPQTEEHAEQDVDNVRFDGARILLVEDHILNIKVVTRLLQAKGVRVQVAKNGKLGVEEFARSVPGFYDLIIMDIRMPEMDGLAAARKIRGMERGDAGNIPIIAMSANAFHEDVAKSRMAGMNEHLAKPIDPKMMYQVLAEYLPPEKVQS